MHSFLKTNRALVLAASILLVIGSAAMAQEPASTKAVVAISP